jgi:hypothetical protein
MGRNIYANAHPVALREMANLVDAVIQGERVKKEVFLERLGTPDGVWAFANLTNVQLQGEYAKAPSIWQKFAQRTVVGDFRQINWVGLSYDLSNWKAADKGVVRAPGALPKVAEGEKYQAFSLTSSTLGFAIEKFGAQFGLTWEAFVNDPYNVVARIPTIFKNAAVDTLDANATKALYAAAFAQPHLVAVSAANSPTGVAVAADQILNLNSLSAARAQLKAKKDSRGNLVESGKLVLVVDPALTPVAESIFAINSLTTRAGTATNFTDTQYAPVLGDIEIVENKYLTFYTGNSTSWILAPAAGDGGAPGPTILQAFLAGEEEPEIRVSGLAGYTPNGQALPFTSGSFDTDTFDMRVRVVGGAGAVNPLPLIMSNGTAAQP